MPRKSGHIVAPLRISSVNSRGLSGVEEPRNFLPSAASPAGKSRSVVTHARDTKNRTNVSGGIYNCDCGRGRERAPRFCVTSSLDEAKNEKHKSPSDTDNIGEEKARK